MKNSFKIFSLLTVILYSQLLSQSSYDMLRDFGNNGYIIFDYQYHEFDHFAHLDSSIILNSFTGKKTVYIDSILYYPDSIKYMLHIEKKGEQVQRTFYDTLSIENINIILTDVVVENSALKEQGADNYIFGWIFVDSLSKSITDTLDSIDMYPYSKIFRNYFPDKDDSLFVLNDTLYIHYRPEILNYFDSYFSTDFQIKKYHGIIKHFNFYSYYGSGFSEEYIKVGSGLIDQINDSPGGMVDVLYLHQNYPNPFNPNTVISFQVEKPENISLKIYDMTGKLIRTIFNDQRLFSEIKTKWDGTDNLGNIVSSGVYIYTLKTGAYTASKKMLLIR